MEKVFTYEEDGVKEICLLTYYPSKYQNSLELTREDLIVSQFVLDFKNGHRPASVLAARIVAKAIEKHFDLSMDPLILIPIPASNKEDSDKRYYLFSYLVSQYCNVVNGQKWVGNWKDVDKKHLSSSHVVQNDQNRWFVNYAKVKNAKVIIFDDIATTGATACEFTERLKGAGAKVVGRIFLASTYQIKGDK